MPYLHCHASLGFLHLPARHPGPNDAEGFSPMIITSSPGRICLSASTTPGASKEPLGRKSSITCRWIRIIKIKSRSFRQCCVSSRALGSPRTGCASAALRAICSASKALPGRRRRRSRCLIFISLEHPFWDHLARRHDAECAWYLLCHSNLAGRIC